MTSVIHQFILDYIGVFLFIIIAAQAIILYGQSRIYEWCKGVLQYHNEILQALGILIMDQVEKTEDKTKKS